MASDLSIELHQLHLLLLQMDDAERSLSHGPVRIAAAEKALKACHEQVENQKLKIKNSRRTIDEGNLKLRTREGELLKLQGMLNQASSNKEYDIVKGQIAAAQQDRAKLEDEALVAMEVVDSEMEQLKSLESVCRGLDEQLKSVQSEVKSQEPGLRSALAAIQTQVSEAEEKIAWSDKLANYRRLRNAHGAGALAGVEDQCCTACSNRVTAQDTVRINTGNMMCCRECGRILYLI